MASNKTEDRKQHLTHSLASNKRAPIWIYLKTKNRDLIRGRKRSWRHFKLGKKIRQIEKV